MNHPSLSPAILPRCRFSSGSAALFACFFAFYLCVYGLESLRLGMVIDEACVMSFPASDETMIANGRWGVWLWGILIGRGAYPFAAGVVAGVFISAALVVQTCLLDLQKRWQQVAYGVFYLTCTQWIFQVCYSHTCAAVGLSFLLGTLAVASLQDSGWRMKALGLLGIAGALSTYQTNVAYCAVLWLAVQLRQLVSEEGLTGRKELLQQAAFFVGGVFIWFLVAELLKLSPFVSQGFLESTRRYQAEMVCWWRLEGESPWSILRTVGHYALSQPLWNILGQHYRGQWLFTTALIPAFALLAGLLLRRRIWTALLAGGMVALMLWLPFMQYGLFLWDAPPRVSVAEPVAVASLWGVFLGTRKLGSRGRMLLTVWLGFLSLKGIYYATAWARDEAYYYERCVEELQDMRSRGIQEAVRAGVPGRRILLLGECPRSGNGWDDVGPCMDRPIPIVLSWEGAFQLYKPYLRLYGMYYGTKEDMEKHQEEFEKMPGWPAVGSVRAHAGEVIIRLTPHVGQKPWLPES